MDWKGCVPKQEGGLGIKKLNDWNRAAMLRHIWNFLEVRLWFYSWHPDGRLYERYGSRMILEVVNQKPDYARFEEW